MRAFPVVREVRCQVMCERCAAVGAGKDVIAVAARLPGGGPDGRKTVKRACKTFYGVLAGAVKWLVPPGARTWRWRRGGSARCRCITPCETRRLIARLEALRRRVTVEAAA